MLTTIYSTVSCLLCYYMILLQYFSMMIVI